MRKAQDGRGVRSIVEEVLQRNVKNMINEQFKLFVSALICLLNLKPVDVESTSSLQRIIREIVQLIEEEGKQRALFSCFHGDDTSGICSLSSVS